MLPLQIKLKGIYSYVSEQNIDFQQLTQERLFGIFGAVGSGKSTILEAMMIALYNKTERLTGRDNKYYNLMNLKSNNLLIEFDFIGGRSQQKYRFKVEGRRNSKRFKDVKTFTRSAYIWNDKKNEWIPTNKTAEEILDLTYENFRRTIIIPQGKFQEFLQLSKGDRAEMLEDIFQLSRFDLSDKVKKLDDLNKENLAEIKGKLDSLQDLEDKNLIEYYECYHRIDEELKRNQIQLTQYQNAIKNYEIIKADFEQLENLEEEFDGLKKQKKEVKKQSNLLDKFIQCQTIFQTILTQLKNAKKAQKEIQAQQKVLEQEKEQIQKTKKELTKNTKEFEEKYKDTKSITQQLNDIEAILKIQEAQKNLQKNSEKFTTQQKEFKALQTKKETLTQQIKEAEIQLEQLQKQLPDAQVLGQINTWLALKKNHANAGQKLEQEYKIVYNKLKAANKEKENIYKESGLPEFIKEDLHTLKVGQIVEKLGNKKMELKVEVEKLNNKMVEVKAHSKLQVLVKDLEEGQPCKICGSKNHPKPLKYIDLEETKSNLTLQKIQQDHQVETIEKTIEQFQFFSKKHAVSKDKYTTLKNEIAENKTILQEHRKQYIWQEYMPADESLLNQKVTEEKNAKKEIEQKQTALKIQKQTLETLDKDIEKNRENLQEAEKIQQAAVTESKVLKAGLKILKWEKFEQESIQQTHQEIKQASTFLTKLEEEQKVINEKETINKTQLSENQKQFKKAEKTIQETQKDLTQKIKKSDFEDTEAIQEVIDKGINITKVQQEIDEFKRQYNSHQTRIKDLRKKIKEKKYSKQVHEHAKCQANLLLQAIDLQKKDLGSVGQNIKETHTNLLKKEHLTKEQDALESRKKDIATLVKMFRGKGFINYVSTLKLKNLCNAANARFQKLTQNQLKLEFNKENQFEVVDYLNGGKVRSVKTLSGGQTFQASLCLAIALSDIVNQHKGEKADFFFLDEGFGALDKNALNLVFEALQSLRSENKIVGVISHVESLKEEITTYLKVENTENGSQVQKSWEL